MKHIRQIIVVGLLNLFCLSSYSQDRSSYYVVIGAFRSEKNAKNFTTSAIRKGAEAKYVFNPTRGLFYVYHFHSNVRREAYSFAIKSRAEFKFKDAWVYEGELGGKEPEPIKEPVIETLPEKIKEEPKTEEPKKEEPKDSVLVEVKKEPVIEEKKPSGKPFVFRLTNADGAEVSGEVHVQESENATQFQVLKANEVVYLEAPKNRNGSYTVMTQAAGYKQSVSTIDYKNPSTEVGSNRESVVSIQLDKAKKGDYIDFTNVRFVRNSVVMESKSKDEIDGLVDLLKENPGYKIRIHGHCNGNQKRDIAEMGTSTNFFGIDKGNVIRPGTAKELSTLRAENVKAYLVSQGIDAKRIDTKGEGGRIPLYDEGGTLGQYNDRIEIEFTKH